MRIPGEHLRKKKAAVSAAAVIAGFIFIAVSFAVFRPEAFFSTMAGRAVGMRLLRMDFVRSFLERRPHLVINPRTVSLGLKHAGLDDIEEFRVRLRYAGERLDWDSLSPARKRRYFEGVYDPDNLRYSIPFLMSLPEEHRAETVNFIAGIVREYRTEMTPADRSELRSHMNSPDGRRVWAESRKYFMTGLSPEQFKAVAPIADEIVYLAATMLE